jgi:hypothetical protein
VGGFTTTISSRRDRGAEPILPGASKRRRLLHGTAGPPAISRGRPERSDPRVGHYALGITGYTSRSRSQLKLIIPAPRLIEFCDSDNAAHKLKAEVRKLAGRWLRDVERRLDDREWIACADFTVADIMMSCVLRSIRKTDLMEHFPRIKALLRALSGPPAWQRTLDLSAERIGVSVDDIR